MIYKIKTLSDEEFLGLSLELENFHSIFYRLWLIGKPFFTESVETACVFFDKMNNGQAISFLFNPNFWDSLDNRSRLFVICHEMLHVILNHGFRMINIEKKDFEICNKALDIVVNHSLIKNFGFNREEIDWIGRDGCWVDTVFPNQEISSEENYEYYFNLLKQYNNISGGNVFDDHEGLLGFENEINEIIEELNNSLSYQEKNSLKDFFQKHFPNNSNKKVGCGIGGWSFINIGKVLKKKKWETVIKRWSQKFSNKDCYDFEQWARKSRRIFNFDGDLMLPSEMEEDRPKEERIEVYFFLDASGSCYHLRERFLRAIKSLSESRFKIRAFSFDTEVHEIDLKNGKIYGGGGTCFYILESKIQEIMRKERVSYPKAVFVISDGYAQLFSCEISKNWYWFLTTNYTSCIPRGSNIYNLANFE